MKNKKIIEKFHKQAQKLQALRSDKRYTEVIAFLAAKGLLQSNNIDAQYKRGQKIPLKNFLWAATNLEPRIYEVLPAAILHFPSSISLRENMPEELKQVLIALRTGENDGPGYMHASYSELKRWADIPLRDKRAKPISQKKIARTYRLRPETIERIRAKSEELGISDAEYIERMLSK